MPFALVFVGMLLVVTGIRDTYKQLGTLVYNDMTGTGTQGPGFLMFLVAIGAVGALGAISQFRTFSHYFMALIIISLLLHNRGFGTQFVATLQGARKSTPVTPGAGSSPLGTQFSGGDLAAQLGINSPMLGAPVAQQGGVTVNLPNVTGIHMTGPNYQ